MIGTSMRWYDCYTFGGDNGYGQPVLSTEPAGKVKMSIDISSQSVQDNINYSGCEYVGLTHDVIDDTCVIRYGEEMLKVLYVNTRGKLNQVYMAVMSHVG